MRLPRRTLLLSTTTAALAIGAPAAQATSPAYQVDPGPLKEEVLQPSPQGGTIGLAYGFGIGRSAAGDARASVTIAVDRPDCVLDAVLLAGGRTSDALAPERGQASAASPLTLRAGGPSPTDGGLSINEGGRQQPACVGARVTVGFGTAPGDQLVPLASIPGRAPIVAPERATTYRTLGYVSRTRRTTIRVSRALGDPGVTYPVRLTRNGTTHATGTLRGTTLRLTTTKGRPRPLGAFALRATRDAASARRIATTAVTLGR